jgi:glutaconate CoA-transferase subunit A
MFCSPEELLTHVPDGASVALAPDYSGCAMWAVRGLMARGVRGLHLIGVPQMGFQADMLIGAGCVETVESAAVTLGEYGPAPRFTAAVKAGSVRILDATCPALHAGLQAAEKGIPFIPLRGLIGSDILARREDWKVVNNPFDENDPVVVLPAIRPDLALLHARVADRDGNVWVGVRRELMLMAHAARRTLVTVERVQETSLLEDEGTAAGTIPGLYLSAVARVRRGAAPVGLAGCYEPDGEALREYAAMAGSEEGFASWMQRRVLADRAA